MMKEPYMPGADTGQAETTSQLKTPPVALLDADHFMLGPTLDKRFPRIDWHQFAAVAEASRIFPGKIIPVTNRPGHVAQQLAETVGAGLAVAESGATFMVCGHKQFHPHYGFQWYQTHVRPEVIKIVNGIIQKRGLSNQVAELEGNLVTACFYPEGGNGSLMRPINEEAQQEFEAEGLMSELRISAGDRLDISPRALDKRQAFQVLMGGLFKYVYNRELPLDALIIGDDSKGAIGFMKEALQASRGQVQLITVANADPELRSFVRQNNGYVSPHLFVRGVQDGLRHALERLGAPGGPGTWRVAVPATAA